MKIQNFSNLVSYYFYKICKTYQLSVVSIDECEVALIRSEYLLLIWYDYDGVSMKYVPLGDEKLSAIDLGGFLASKRKWHIADVSAKYQGLNKLIRQGIASYALTLETAAHDILEGEKKWFNEIIHPPIILSQPAVDRIKVALRKITKE